MIIRVSGYPGAGKTTLCKELVTKLDYEYHGASEIFRDLSAKRGISIEEFCKLLETEPELDRAVDAEQQLLMQTHTDLILDGRIAPFLPCPHPSVKLLLTVAPDEAARRNISRPENAGRTLEEMRALTESRVAADRARYRALYGIRDFLDPASYDLTLDTTPFSIAETFAEALKLLTPRLAAPARS